MLHFKNRAINFNSNNLKKTDKFKCNAYFNINLLLIYWKHAENSTRYSYFLNVFIQTFLFN